jgi:hypothetical protein
MQQSPKNSYLSPWHDFANPKLLSVASSDTPSRRISVMKIRTLLFGTLLIGLIPATMIPMIAYSQTTGTQTMGSDAPEIDACTASGLIALKERSPAIKDVTLDLDSVRVVKMSSKIANVEIKAIVLGDVNIEKKKSSKPQDLICILGEKGKVLLTIFSDKTSTEAD